MNQRESFEKENPGAAATATRANGYASSQTESVGLLRDNSAWRFGKQFVDHHEFTAMSSVWHDSTTREVRFQPMPKRQVTKLWHDARRFERQTRRPGRQDGAIGRNGLAVLHALLFDFLNYRSGALYPSWAAIARKACVSVRSVGRGLAKLRAAGVLHWVRRCVAEWIDGRFTLRQQSNAYAVLTCSHWRGYCAPAPAPLPRPGTWGDHPPMNAINEALAAGRLGCSIADRVTALQSDPSDRLAAALAKLGAAIAHPKTQAFTGMSGCPSNM